MLNAKYDFAFDEKNLVGLPLFAHLSPCISVFSYLRISSVRVLEYCTRTRVVPIYSKKSGSNLCSKCLQLILSVKFKCEKYTRYSYSSLYYSYSKSTTSRPTRTRRFLRQVLDVRTRRLSTQLLHCIFLTVGLNGSCLNTVITLPQCGNFLLLFKEKATNIDFAKICAPLHAQ